MSDDHVPEVVQRLVREQVRTYDALEVVLFLHRESGRRWRPAEVAAAVRLSEDVAATVLNELAQHHLVVGAAGPKGPAFRLNTERAEVASAVSQLAAAWDAHRLALIRLLNANALERLRTGAARALSDAFLFNKRKNDG